jgi:hypothetical protein
MTADYRSTIIKKFIDIEKIMVSLISQHYFNNVRADFISTVLFDEACTFGTKRRIIEKIVPKIDNKKMQKLNRLNKIRNCFAHCNLTLYEEPDFSSNKKNVDPRNFNKEIEYSVLHSKIGTTPILNIDIWQF